MAFRQIAPLQLRRFRLLICGAHVSPNDTAALYTRISKPVENYAVHSKLDPKSLTTELTKIRKQGYATSRDELIEGAVAVAAPFFNSAGQVTGSIAIFGPSVRLKDKKVSESGKLLISEARLLSAALGDKNDILE